MGSKFLSWIKWPRARLDEADASAPPEIEWCRSLDNPDLVLGFCGSMGADGVYRFWLDKSDDWEFCPAETKAWDWYHQKRYRQGKVELCTFDEVREAAPPLPRRFPPPVKYHLLDPPEPKTANARRGSKVFDRVLSAPDRRLPVYVVLREDRYESLFGDGVFRDFEAAFLDAASAEHYIENDAEQHEFLEYHLREVYLAVSGKRGVLDTEGCNLSPFDHFTGAEICDDLVKKLR
jgi:hypothetical protein